MSANPIAVIGGGPVGLTLALLLARRHVPSVVVDARSIDDAKRDRRLLALSRGTLDTLGAVVELPAAALAPIRSVVVSSRGEFGRAVLDEHENGGKALGATVRYGDLLTALAAACVAHPLVTVRRPCAMSSMRQTASAVELVLPDGETLMASLAVNAEGTGASGTAPSARQAALTGDVEVEGPTAGTAFERFTRDGPLALLPLPGPASGTARTMSLVWCMPSATADRREHLPDAELLAELQTEFGERTHARDPGARIWLLTLGLRHPAGVDLLARLRLEGVETEGLDRDALAEAVLRDRLAVHPRDRDEVLVVPAGRGGADEEEDGDDDDGAEGEVEVEVAAGVGLVAAAAAGPRRLGAEGHGVEDSRCGWRRRGVARGHATPAASAAGGPAHGTAPRVRGRRHRGRDPPRLSAGPVARERPVERACYPSAVHERVCTTSPSPSGAPPSGPGSRASSSRDSASPVAPAAHPLPRPGGPQARRAPTPSWATSGGSSTRSSRWSSTSSSCRSSSSAAAARLPALHLRGDPALEVVHEQRQRRDRLGRRARSGSSSRSSSRRSSCRCAARSPASSTSPSG